MTTNETSPESALPRPAPSFVGPFCGAMAVALLALATATGLLSWRCEALSAALSQAKADAVALRKDFELADLKLKLDIERLLSQVQVEAERRKTAETVAANAHEALVKQLQTMLDEQGNATDDRLDIVDSLNKQMMDALDSQASWMDETSQLDKLTHQRDEEWRQKVMELLDHLAKP